MGNLAEFPFLVADTAFRQCLLLILCLVASFLVFFFFLYFLLLQFGGFLVQPAKMLLIYDTCIVVLLCGMIST